MSSVVPSLVSSAIVVSSALVTLQSGSSPTGLAGLGAASSLRLTESLASRLEWIGG